MIKHIFKCLFLVIEKYLKTKYLFICMSKGNFFIKFKGDEVKLFDDWQEFHRKNGHGAIKKRVMDMIKSDVQKGEINGDSTNNT